MDILPPISPPKEFLSDPLIQFVPSPEMVDWMFRMFINEDAKLFNPEHSHLQHADIGFLWTTYGNESKGRRVLGMAETFSARSHKWAKARQEQQMEEWFGLIPDFIITVDANYWMEADNPQRFALIEHELYHCAQATDDYGAPAFYQSSGLPKYTMRGHDVEEFVGVVRRYGAEATGISEMVHAANKGAEIATATVDGLCGTCQKRVA